MGELYCMAPPQYGERYISDTCNAVIYMHSFLRQPDCCTSAHCFELMLKGCCAETIASVKYQETRFVRIPLKTLQKFRLL